MHRVLGVDPGAKGALALLIDGRLEQVVDMPFVEIRRGKTNKKEVEGYALSRILRAMAPDIAYIEQVGGFEGQAAGAAFNFGRAAGAPEYQLKAFSVRVEFVHPATWKKAMRLKGGKDDSRNMAMRLWPEHAELFARVKDDGRAEAALIASYGLLQQGGMNGAGTETNRVGPNGIFG